MVGLRSLPVISLGFVLALVAERGIRTLELSGGSATCREPVAKDATRANNATPPCPILPDGLVIEAVCLPQRLALSKPQPLGEGGPPSGVRMRHAPFPIGPVAANAGSG